MLAALSAWLAADIEEVPVSMIRHMGGTFCTAEPISLKPSRRARRLTVLAARVAHVLVVLCHSSAV